MGKKHQEIAVRESTAVDVTMNASDDAWKLSQRIANTEFVPQALRGKPESVLACILTGVEAGVSPMQSLAKIHVIQGRPAVSSELQRAMVLSAGHEIHIEESNSTRCVVIGKRAGSSRETRMQYTMDDAKRANLNGKENWRNHPQSMLLARATSLLCRAVFPDVLAGLSYTVEELTDGDVIDAGEITAGETHATPKKKRAAKKRATRRVTAADGSGSGAADPAPPPPAPAPPLPGEEEDAPAPAPAPEPEPPTDDDDIIDAEVIEENPAPEPSERTYTAPQLIAMKLSELGITDRVLKLRIVGLILGRPIDTTKGLTPEDEQLILNTLQDPDVVAEYREQAEEALTAPEEPATADQPAPAPAAPEPITADEIRALAKRHKVKLTEILKYVSSEVGHKVVTVDDIVEIPDVGDWLPAWIDKRGGA